MLAVTCVIDSSLVFCCRGAPEGGGLDYYKTPLQTVDGLFAVQSENGKIQLRLEADRMERYETDEMDYDSFPDGIAVYAYTEDGLLESVIIADEALHKVPKGESAESSDEVWEAFGNVLLHNILNRQTLETDTLYWDRSKQEVYTDCYVRLYSPDGFMQGYGMRSDDRMKNARLDNNFSSYVYVQRDTSEVVIDSVNFIGPFQK